jgi:hypothetical protein
MLTWKLCDLNGTPYNVLNDRLPGGTVDVTLNDLWTAQVSLSNEDPAVANAYPLYSVLKVLLEDVPLFTGTVIKRRSQLSGVTQLNAVSQGLRLQRLFTGQRADGGGINGAVSWNPWRLEGLGIASHIEYLLMHVQPTAAEVSSGVEGTGIVWGNANGGLGPVVIREYPPGTQIWRVYTDFTGLADGIDFQLTPLDLTNGQLNRLDTFRPRQGADRSSSIVFHAGWGQENASDFTWDPDGGPVINRSTFVGQVIEGEPQKFARADQPESQKAFGQYGDFQGRTDLQLSSQLAEFAQGAVSLAGWPIDYFTIVPALDDGSGYVRDSQTGAWTKLPRTFQVPPSFGPGPNHDYWLGDTIRAIAKDPPGLDENLTGRVLAARLTEHASGAVIPEVTCAPTISAVGVTTVTG